MINSGQTFLEWVGLSGVLALIGGTFWGGSLSQRVGNLEKHVEHDTSQENAVSIARLEEQYKAMQSDITEIKRAVVK
jgi:hypothetical protein